MFFVISNRTVQNPQNLNENIIKKTKRTQSKTYCFSKWYFLHQGNFWQPKIFTMRRKFSTSKDFSLTKTVFHKQRFSHDQGSFPQAKIFTFSRKFSTSNDFSVSKDFFLSRKFSTSKGKDFFVSIKVLSKQSLYI